MSLVEDLFKYEKVDRAAVLAFPDSAQRDVLRQLAAKSRWDGNINSKSGRDVLVAKGLVARYQGYNFLTQDGYAVVDVLWGLSNFIET